MKRDGPPGPRSIPRQVHDRRGPCPHRSYPYPLWVSSLGPGVQGAIGHPVGRASPSLPARCARVSLSSCRRQAKRHEHPGQRLAVDLITACGPMLARSHRTYGSAGPPLGHAAITHIHAANSSTGREPVVNAQVSASEYTPSNSLTCDDRKCPPPCVHARQKPRSPRIRPTRPRYPRRYPLGALPTVDRPPGSDPDGGREVDRRWFGIIASPGVPAAYGGQARPSAAPPPPASAGLVGQRCGVPGSRSQSIHPVHLHKSHGRAGPADTGAGQPRREDRPGTGPWSATGPEREPGGPRRTVWTGV